MYMCNCCGGSLEKIFDLGMQPLANKYPYFKRDFETEFSQKLEVYLCSRCGYCHVPCIADRALFFENYYYLSSVNKELVDHFTEMADWLEQDGARFVLDVGSNDGVLLKPLRDLGIRCIGIDPSRNVGEIANRNGLETIIGFFDSDIAKKLIQEKGRPDVIVASSVFTHLSDPGDFFSVCHTLLEEGGRVVIEIEFLNDIIESLGFERFYFDRPHYYSINSLRYISLRYGFIMTDIERIKTHGGSVRVTFCRSIDHSRSKGNNFSDTQTLTGERITSRFEEFNQSCLELKHELKQYKRNGIRIGAYGCPARFSTITNFAEIGSDLIPFVVDDSPLKQGRSSPGQHIKILSYEDSPKVSTYLVFAYEYIDSIRSRVSRSDVMYLRPVPLTKL